MTINVQIRKGAVVVVTESVIQTALATRQDGEEVNVIIYPGARLAVLEDGATAEEIERIVVGGG